MRTWIPGSTIGTAIIARDRLDQVLQAALVAHLLTLVDGGHVCVFGLRLRGPLGSKSGACWSTRLACGFGCGKDQGQRGVARRGGKVVCSHQ